MYKFYNSIILTVSVLTLLSSTQSAFAQAITIDSGDLPERNQTYRISTGDSLLQLDPSLTGTDYTWDFSGLNAIVQQKDSFLSANDMPLTLRFFFPLGLTFPSDVSLLQYIDTPDSLGGVQFGSGFQVYEVRSNLLLGHGFGGSVQGIPLALQNQPPDTVYRFPMNYGNVDSANTLGEFDLPGVAFYQQARKRVNEVDGWGSLTTPFGTFDVLRVRTLISGRDSVKFDTLQGFSLDIPTQIEYKWLGKDQGVPLLQMNATIIGGTEVINSIRYRDSARAGVPVVSLESGLASSIAIYPNPTSDQLTIEPSGLSGQAVRIQVFDTRGMLHIDHSNTRTGQKIILPVSQLTPGFYLLKVETDRGEAIVRKVQIE